METLGSLPEAISIPPPAKKARKEKGPQKEKKEKKPKTDQPDRKPKPKRPQKSPTKKPIQNTDKKDFGLCVVCGCKADGWNYSAITCGACSGFFRRYTMKNRQAVCITHLGECNVKGDENRNRCAACRFKKCKEAKMRIDDASHRRHRMKKEMPWPGCAEAEEETPQTSLEAEHEHFEPELSQEQLFESELNQEEFEDGSLPLAESHVSMPSAEPAPYPLIAVAPSFSNSPNSPYSSQSTSTVESPPQLEDNEIDRNPDYKTMARLQYCLQSTCASLLEPNFLGPRTMTNFIFSSRKTIWEFMAKELEPVLMNILAFAKMNHPFCTWGDHDAPLIKVLRKSAFQMALAILSRSYRKQYGDLMTYNGTVFPSPLILIPSHLKYEPEMIFISSVYDRIVELWSLGFNNTQLSVFLSIMLHECAGYDQHDLRRLMRQYLIDERIYHRMTFLIRLIEKVSLDHGAVLRQFLAECPDAHLPPLYLELFGPNTV